MLRRVHFECGACSASFVARHDEDRESLAVFCVNCGEPIAEGVPITSIADERAARRGSRAGDDRALGLLKSAGRGFPDTLPGLSPASPSHPPLPPVARAGSEAPRPESRGDAQTFGTVRRPRLGPLAALVLGFLLGVPVTSFAGHLIEKRHRPVLRHDQELARNLALAAAALDDGDFEAARKLLAESSAWTFPTDRRLAILRARLAFVRADAEWIRQRALRKLGSKVSEASRKAFADLAFAALDSARHEQAAANSK